jgi:hypothetical protein
MLFKKGSKVALDNYRQITVQCTLRQIFCRVIETRVTKFVRISEYQNGFRSGRCAADNAFVLTQSIQEIHQRRKSREYIAFIDFRKAFNSVDIPTLLQKLQQKVVNDSLIWPSVNRWDCTKLHKPNSLKATLQHQGSSYEIRYRKAVHESECARRLFHRRVRQMSHDRMVRQSFERSKYSSTMYQASPHLQLKCTPKE